MPEGRCYKGASKYDDIATLATNNVLEVATVATNDVKEFATVATNNGFLKLCLFYKFRILLRSALAARKTEQPIIRGQFS